MGDAGLTRLQGQSHRAQPCGNLVLATVDNRLILMEYHQIIRVDHDVGRLKAAASTAGKLRAQVGLQAVEGDMRQ